MSNEVILYCAPLVLGAVVCLALAISAWRYRHVPGALALFVLLLAISSWALSYAFEIASLDLPTKILCAKVEYLGAQTTGISWLAFCLSYTGLTGKRSWRTLQVLAVFPLLTLILAVTNEAHYLTWASTRLDTAGPVPMLVVTHGAWFWVNVASSYLFLIAGAFRIVWVVVRMPDVYRSQAGALLVAVLAPLTGNVFYILNIVPLTYLDPTPYCFLIVGAALGWRVLKFRLLSLFIGLVPAARDAIVEGMADGVVVLDAANNIADINPSAERLGCASLFCIGSRPTMYQAAQGTNPSTTARSSGLDWFQRATRSANRLGSGSRQALAAVVGDVRRPVATSWFGKRSGNEQASIRYSWRHGRLLGCRKTLTRTREVVRNCRLGSKRI